jgi:DNA-binding GntR family transcriptional regulator
MRAAAEAVDQAVRNQSRSQYVYEIVRQIIQDGHFARGDRVREEEIAAALGVSRTPVREALQRLQSRGLLEFAEGRLVVAELTQQQTLELYAMRESLEGCAARLAAQHAADFQIIRMRKLCEQFEDAPDLRRMASINRDFHQTIYEAAQNRYLIQTLDELHDALALLRNTTFAIPERAPLAAAEHRDIVDAIQNRNAEESERLARHHIRRAQAARMQMLAEGV